MNETTIYSIFSLAAGLSVGAMIGWLVGRKSAPDPVDVTSDGRIEAELRSQIETHRAELTRVASGRMESEKARSAADARVQAAEQRIDEQRRLNREQFTLFKEEQDRNMLQMRDSFSALSSEALGKLQPQFLAAANETLAKHAETAKGDLATRQEAISALLSPIEALLRTSQERLAQSETTQSAAIGEVTKHLETLAQQSSVLSGETLQLRKVLGAGSTRGRWGEETLKRCVEASGLSAHCDFTEQSSSDDKRPDMIVKLPGDRLIIVDSKVPDLELISSLHESDDTKRAEALKQHADKMRGTIKALADRDYQSQFSDAVDFVILFVPTESIFAAACEGDKDLLVWAGQRRIVLATPATLIATLRCVAMSWKQHEQTVNAREIATAAEELYSRVATFVQHFDAIRKGLAGATEAYNSAVGSYDRSVKPQGERILKLGASSAGKQMAEPVLISDSLRLAPAAKV